MRENRILQGLGLLSAVIALSHCGQGASNDDAGGTTQVGGTGGATPKGGAGGGGGSGNHGGSGGAGSGGTSGGAATAGVGARAGATACQTPEVIAVRPALPTPVDEATFTAQWPAGICAAMKPCCAAIETPFEEAKCLTYAASVFETTGMKFDGLQAAQCLASLKLAAAACGATRDSAGAPSSCALVYRGSQPPGAACDYSADCAPDPRGTVACDPVDYVCNVDIRGKLDAACQRSCESAAGLRLCYGVNTQTPGAVVTCYADDGLRCTDASSKDTGKGTCQPAVPVGCTCDEFGDTTQICNAKGSCDRDDDVCVARGEAGTACRIDEACTFDTYCPNSGGTAVCTPRKHAGEDCEYGHECIGNECSFGTCALDNGDEHIYFRDAYCDGVGTY